MDSIKVSLKDILKDKSYADGGLVLFDIADKAIPDGDTVVIDMEGVLSIPTLFMNTSFGDLIVKHGIERTKKIFLFNNVNRIQFEKIQKYFNDFQALCEKMELEMNV